MYQTLYRKYRPKNFGDVVGQNVIVKTLNNEIKLNQLNHAFLFTGPRGTGKTSVAKILAKTINCSETIEGVACDKCVNCTQIDNHQSTDIIEIDAASNNGVDEIRELKSKVNLVPSTGKYKVYIIDEVHMLTLGAFNALLKTLEEPPAHIIFILATTDPHKIPTTILSRCQRFDFKKITIKNLLIRLNQIVELENIKIDDEALLEIARLSDGGMRDALSMLEQVIVFSDEKITVEDVHEINGTLSENQLSVVIEYLLKNDLAAELNLIDELNNDGKNLVKLTEELIQFLRNLLLYVTAPNYFEKNSSSIEDYEKISREINKKRLIRIIKEFNKTLSEMHNSNNPKLLLELLFISLISINEKESEKISNVENYNTEVSGNEALDKVSILKKKKHANEGVQEIVQTTRKEETHENSEGDTKLDRQENIEVKNELSEVIMTRVNNALAGFNKKYFLEVKKQLEQLQTLLIDTECSKYISMIMDAELKAAGNNYLIFVNKTEKMSNIFNGNIIEIEGIIYNKFNIEYKIVSIDLDRWGIFRNEFNSKTKTYVLKEEAYDLKKILENNKINSSDNKSEENVIQNLFGDMIEYEEK